MAHAALGIDCVTCPAKVGEECFTVKFDQPKPRSPHAKRVEAAREQGLARTPDSAPPQPRNRVIKEQQYPENYEGPYCGDYVMYHTVSIIREHGVERVVPDTYNHTARVLGIEFERGGALLLIRPTPALGDNTPWEGHHENDTAIAGAFVDGWWPDDQEEPKNAKNMRKVTRW